MAKKGYKKCIECGKSCNKEEMYKNEELSKRRNGEFYIREDFYCSESCFREKENRKKIIEEINDMFSSLVEIPVRGNIYFNKLFSPIKDHYGYKVIHSMLLSEYCYLSDALNKDFLTVNVKIKYLMAIVQNKIEEYKVIEENKESLEVVSHVSEYEEIEIKNQVVHKKKSIFDI